MTRRRSGAGVLAILMVVLAGCGRREEPSPAAAHTPAPQAAPADAPGAAAPARPAGKEHDFLGEVKAVDAADGKITVTNDNIEGWMNTMTMTYGVDHRDILPTIKPGDRIRAHVYDGEFQMLYDVRLVVAPPKLP